MRPSQATRAMSIFDSLPVKTKNEIFQEMLNLGLRISFNETTWHRHIRQRVKSTKGNLKRYYAALTNFNPNDVKTFLAAFSEQNGVDNNEKNTDSHDNCDFSNRG